MKINLQRRETVLNSLSPFHFCRCIRGFFVIQVWKMYGCPENQFRGFKTSITITPIFEAWTWSVGVTMCFLFINVLVIQMRNEEKEARHQPTPQPRAPTQTAESMLAKYFSANRGSVATRLLWLSVFLRHCCA